MAKRKPQPLFMFTICADNLYTLHVHMTESRRQNHKGRLYAENGRSICSDIYLNAAKDLALRGKLKEIHAYGSWRADNGKVYADAQPTVMTYDPTSGEYGWDMLLDRIRQLVRSHRVPDEAGQPPFEEVKVPSGKTELEW